MYPFLAWRLMQLGGQDHNSSVILPVKNPCALNRKLGEPLDATMELRKRENFFPLTVFIIQTVQTAESIRRIK